VITTAFIHHNDYNRVTFTAVITTAFIHNNDYNRVIFTAVITAAFIHHNDYNRVTFTAVITTAFIHHNDYNPVIFTAVHVQAPVFSPFHSVCVEKIECRRVRQKATFGMKFKITQCVSLYRKFNVESSITVWKYYKFSLICAFRWFPSKITCHV
jgi:hypothetical protein